MQFKYTITADINPCDVIPTDREDDYKEAIQEAFEERVNTMFKEGWHHAEFIERVRFDYEGEPEDGVLFSGWITLTREIENA